MSINNINCENVKKKVTLPALAKAKRKKEEEYFFIVKNYEDKYKLIRLRNGLVCDYKTHTIEDLLKHYECELISDDISLSYKSI